MEMVSHDPMPAISNPRHERFARAWFKTGNAAKSYLKAGYKPTTRHALDVAASRLLRHDEVHRRIQELRKQMATRERISVASLIEELDAAKALAERLEQPATMVTASMSKARLAGLLVDRKEHGQPGDFAKAQTTEEVIAAIAAELGEETAAALRASLERQEEAEVAAPEPVDQVAIAVQRAPGDTLN